jgi:hypothetical protein
MGTSLHPALLSLASVSSYQPLSYTKYNYPPKVKYNKYNHQIYFSIITKRMETSQFRQEYLSPNFKPILIGRFVIEYLKGENNGEVVVYDFSLVHWLRISVNIE